MCGFCRLLNCVSTDEVENGMLGYIGEQIDNYKDIYNFVVGTPTNNETIAVVYNPIGYNCRMQAGIPFRAFIPKAHDELTIISNGKTKVLQFSKDLEPRYFEVDGQALKWRFQGGKQ